MRVRRTQLTPGHEGFGQGSWWQGSEPQPLSDGGDPQLGRMIWLKAATSQDMERCATPSNGSQPRAGGGGPGICGKRGSPRAASGALEMGMSAQT